MVKGDIVLIPFPFTNLSGDKVRPAIILIETASDITVAFITTQLKWQDPTDIELLPSKTNGIKKPSIIRLSKIATIDKDLAIGLLGSLNKQELAMLNSNLKRLLQL